MSAESFSASLALLHRVSRQLAELRKQRDGLIRAHPGTLREIAGAAGVSPETVRQIKKGEGR